MFTLTKDDLTLTIDYDTDPVSPRNWDNLGTVALGSRRYSFGDEHLDLEGINAITDDPDYAYLPIYLYDHSGITIKTTPFGCGWDSGLVGIIYAKLSDEPEMPKEKILDVLKSEISTLDDYLQGNVYAFSIKDSDGDYVDGCCGFYGFDNCKSDGINALDALVESRAKTRKAESEESDYWACRDVLTVA